MDAAAYLLVGVMMMSEYTLHPLVKMQNNVSNMTADITNSPISMENSHPLVVTTIQEYMLRTHISLEDVVRNIGQEAITNTQSE